MCKIVYLQKPPQSSLNTRLLSCLLDKGYKYGKYGFGFTVIYDDKKYIVHKTDYQNFHKEIWFPEFNKAQKIIFHFRNVRTISSITRDYQPIISKNYILFQAGLTNLAYIKGFKYNTQNNAERLIAHLEYLPNDIVLKTLPPIKFNAIVINKKDLLSPLVYGAYDKVRVGLYAYAYINYHFRLKDYLKCFNFY